MATEGNVGASGNLSIQHTSGNKTTRHDPPSEVRAWLKSIGEDAESFIGKLPTRLFAQHFRPHPEGTHIGHHVNEGPPPNRPHVIVHDSNLHGVPHALIGDHDLGSGTITNAGSNLYGNDFTWTGATGKNANFHLLGTGATASAATDVFIQTPIGAGSLTGSTNGYMTGTQSYVSPNKYQTVATFTSNATLAITEWGLALSNAATLSRTSAGAAPTNNTFTDTGATFTTAGAGLQQFTVEIASSILNTPTTTVMGQILSNTATVLTLQGPSASAAWLTLANAVASVPGATVAYQVFPTMLDHKQFAAINVVAADTLAITYAESFPSGG